MSRLSACSVKGAIGFGLAVLRTPAWLQDRKEYIDVLHCKGLVWNNVSTDNQPLNAEQIEEFLRDAHPDAQNSEFLGVKRAHMKLFGMQKEPPPCSFECCTGVCCGVCAMFGQVAANCSCP